MIYNATHTGDNEFELDGVPLGQVGRGWGEVWEGLWCVGRLEVSEEGGGDGGTVSIGSSQ